MVMEAFFSNFHYCDYNRFIIGRVLPQHFSAFDHTQSIFGGMYSVAHNEEYNVANHYTNDITCPDGYSPNAVGKFQACYQCGDVHLYLCLQDDATEDPRGFFGGMYNENFVVVNNLKIH